jgi:hypothetical protein
MRGSYGDEAASAAGYDSLVGTGTTVLDLLGPVVGAGKVSGHSARIRGDG